MLALAAGTAEARPLIEIRGNAKVDAEFILGSFPDKTKYTDQDIDDAVKSLFASGAFSDVKVKRNGSGLSVDVAEMPIVANVVFSGNDRLDDDRLASEVSIDAGTPLDPATLGTYERRIEAAYAATGRKHATAKAVVHERGNGFYDVDFRVTEGERSKTADIWFDGNGSFSGLKLRAVVATKRTNLLTKLFSRDVVDEGKLEIDRDRLVAFYRSKGFADVSVSEPEVDFDGDGDNVMVGFRIVEGPRYKIAAVDFDNTTKTALPAPEAAAAKSALVGSFYDPSKADKSGDAVSVAMERAGLPAAQVAVRTERNADGTVNLRYTVDEAARSYVERIEIGGNQVTKDYVIRRELDLSEGDLYSRRLLREAERRLNRLGFFKSVKISTAKGSADDRIVIKIDVVEDQTGEITIGGAYSTTDGPMAVVSLSQSNLFGTGRGFSVSAGQGTETGNYNLSFTEPYLFGNRLSGTAEVFRHTDESRENAFRPYDETVNGTRFTLKGPMSANTEASVYYALTDSEISDVEGKYSGAHGGPRLVANGSRIKSSLGYNWAFDTLDDTKNPTSGMRITFGQEFAGLGGDVSFVKNEASGRFYKELSEKREIVGSIGVRAGYIAPVGDGLDFADHYRMGSDLVRGFASGGIGPRDKATGFLLGGEYYAAATAEAIYPIPVLSDGLGINGTVFADIGSVWGADGDSLSRAGSEALYDSASVRASIGTGIVWDSPIGLFKANIALPVLKEDGDRTQVFSLTGGTKF
jgi:outer membrane protein insertion porin family